MMMMMTTTTTTTVSESYAVSIFKVKVEDA
jgi:hypothetical protein